MSSNRFERCSGKQFGSAEALELKIERRFAASTLATTPGTSLHNAQGHGVRSLGRETRSVVRGVYCIAAASDAAHAAI